VRITPLCPVQQLRHRLTQAGIGLRDVFGGLQRRTNLHSDGYLSASQIVPSITCPQAGQSAYSVGVFSFLNDFTSRIRHGRSARSGAAREGWELRGTSVNPVPDVEHVLVTAGTGVPTSGLILG
jgi:hypothetical protein